MAVADPDLARRERLAALTGAAAHRSGAELVAAGGLDAVVIASPAAAHLEDARHAAAAGVAALVEKPPAPDAGAATDLAALEPPPAIGFNRRFAPPFAGLRAAVAGGAGEPELELEIRYRRSGWRAHTVADDALLDLGPHLVDAARWAAAAAATHARALELTPRRFRAELALERGHALLTGATDRPWRERAGVRAAGAEPWRAAVGGTAAGVRARLRRSAPEHPLVPSLAAQLEAFAATVRGDRRPELATAADGAAVMRVLEALRRSGAADGEWAPVEAG